MSETHCHQTVLVSIMADGSVKPNPIDVTNSVRDGPEEDGSRIKSGVTKR